MTTTRKIGLAIAVLIALIVAFNIYYFMPRATMVSITRTEVQAHGQQGARRRERDHAGRPLLVYATDFETGRRRLRNEDNGWYFKFDARDIAARGIQAREER